MKRFYIAERFSFDLDPETEDNQIVYDDLSALSKKYKYFPKSKGELKKLVDELIEERGNEADLNDIYTGDITNMSGLFANRKHFNGDISDWDVSNVKNMSRMFYHCENFNQDIRYWDVSNVEDMDDMFSNCANFVQDLSKWDTRNVVNKNGNEIFWQCFRMSKANWPNGLIRHGFI